MNQEFIALMHLLARGRSSDAAVCFDSGGDVCWEHFQDRVRALASHLAPLPGDRWCLYCDDSLAFAVGLLALFHTGKTAVMPPNIQHHTLEEVLSSTAGAVSDCIPGGLQPLACAGRAPFLFSALEEKRPCVELWTSGSTGDRKRAVKTGANLITELEAHRRLWGDSYPHCRVFPTVSHQHIYGLLFRILYPLASGQPFYRSTISFPEMLPRLMSCSESAMLISSPAHLKRLPELIDISRLAPACRVILSSTGVLPPETARNIAEQCHADIVEIYGSTETGGVAARLFSPGRETLQWRALPGVRLRAADEESVLEVSSPFTSGLEGGGWFRTGDCVQMLDDERFILAGRADDIVKVEGKRLSLAEMRQALLLSGYITDAAVLLLPTAMRDTIGAVVELSKAGWSRLETEGRLNLTRKLRELLLDRFEAVVIPKRFRFVPRIPCDAQGKPAKAELLALFDAAPPTEPLMPRLLAICADGQKVTAELEIPADLGCLRGHFPGRPVVPGFMLIDWVFKLAEQCWQMPVQAGKFEALKFFTPLLPGSRCSLCIERQRDPGTLRYIFFDKDKQYAAGRALLRPDVPPRTA